MRGAFVTGDQLRGVQRVWAQGAGALSAVARSAGSMSLGALSSWALRVLGPKCVGGVKWGPLSAAALCALAFPAQVLEAFDLGLRDR